MLSSVLLCQEIQLCNLPTHSGFSWYIFDNLILLLQKGGGSLPPYIDFTRDTMAGGGVKVRRPMLRHYRALPYRDDQ